MNDFLSHFSHLTPQLIHFMIFIFGLLIFATALTWILDIKKKGKLKEIKLRIISWWVISALTLGSVILGKYGVIVFFAAVSFLGLSEYLKIIPQRKVDKRIPLYLFLAILLQYYWVSIEWYNMFLVFIPVYVFLFLPIRLMLTGEIQDYLRSASFMYWGMMMNVFCISHLAYLFLLPSIKTAGTYGAGHVMYLIFLTEANDVAQFLWGKMLGKRKIAPSISPNKTWAGFLGGVFTTTVASLFLGPFLTPMNIFYSAVAGAGISIFGFFGDISVSAIKRDIGVKDSGSLIPGHGGILDRIDSLTYTSLLFFHFSKYFYY